MRARARYLVDPPNVDTIAFTFLLNDGTIWRQIGTYAIQIPLGGGNIVIHK